MAGVNRLEFFDPHANSDQPMTKQEALLNFQVYRFRKNAQGGLSPIPGIRVNSKSYHFLSQILFFLSLGYICKSFQVSLNGRIHFINMNSYNKWRDQNGDALVSLGVIIKSDRKQMPFARKKEILNLVKLLSTPKDQRQKLEQSISTGVNAFEIAEHALKLADKKVELLKRICTEETLEKTRYELAAYYILVSSRIEQGCTEVLRVSHHYITVDSNPTDQDAERLANSTPQTTLSDSDKEAAETIKKVKIEEAVSFDPSRIQILRKKTDLFQDVYQGTYPVQAKKLLNQLAAGSDGFYKTFANLIANPICGLSPVFSSPAEKALYEHIQCLGRALRTQFTSYNTNEVILSALKSGFRQLAKENLFDEDTVLEFGRAFSTLAALRLLSSAEAKQDDNEKRNRITCQTDDQHVLSFTFPKGKYIDTDSNQPYFPAYLTPLSGCLRNDGIENNFATADEIFKLIQEMPLLGEKDRNILDQLVYDRQVAPLVNKSTSPQLASQHIWAKVEKMKIMDHDYFQHLVKLCETIERVGNVVRNRYWDKLGHRILASFQFLPSGKIDRNQLKKHARINCSPDEHKRMIDKYFKDIPNRNLIDMPERTKTPRFTQEELKTLPRTGNDLVSILYHIPHSNGDIGNCGFGAVAQALFKGHYDPNRKIWVKDYSRDTALLEKLRKALCQYMLDHPEEVCDILGRRVVNFHNQTMETPKEAVDRRVSELSNTSSSMRAREATWLGSSDLYVLSRLLHRPIHVISAGNVKVDQKGRIIAEKFGDEFNSKPLTFYHQGNHYDWLIEKREGTEKIS
jgi:hypothetical protein